MTYFLFIYAFFIFILSDSVSGSTPPLISIICASPRRRSLCSPRTSSRTPSLSSVLTVSKSPVVGHSARVGGMKGRQRVNLNRSQGAHHVGVEANFNSGWGTSYFSVLVWWTIVDCQVMTVYSNSLSCCNLI